MTTSALPRGKTLEVLVKDQTDFSTAATGNYTRTYIYKQTLSEKRPLEADPLLGTPRQNNRDTTAPAPGLPTHNGQIEAPLCLNHTGLWLKSTFGAPTTTNSSGNYTHTFVSGGEVIPFKTFESKIGDNFIQHRGLLVSKLSIDAGRTSGYRMISLDMVGRSEHKLVSSGGGTPASPMALDQVAATVGVFKINGVTVADIMSVSLEYDNKPAPKDYLGDEYISGYDLDEEATLTGNIKLRFRTMALYDLAAANTAFAAELLFERGANNSLSFAAPALRMERQGIEISGPGGIEQTFAFQGSQTSGAAMLSVVLKNQIASY